MIPVGKHFARVSSFMVKRGIRRDKDAHAKLSRISPDISVFIVPACSYDMHTGVWASVSSACGHFRAGPLNDGRYCPVPVRVTTCGLVTAESVNVSVPVTAPVAVGEKVTPTVQLAPAPMLAPQVLLATANPVLAVTGAIVRALLR